MILIETAEALAETLITDPLHIAVCLLRINRFNGQHPTSNVLLHSMDVAKRVKGLGPQVEMWAMLHDAHEILSGDHSRHWKHQDIIKKQNDADKYIRKELKLTLTDAQLWLVNVFDIESGNAEKADGAKMRYPYSTSGACLRFEQMVRDWVAQ